jgi:propionyl-CoA synthetase
MVGLDGYVPVKYGSTFTACPGYDVQVVDDLTRPLPAKELGNIVIKVQESAVRWGADSCCP